MSALRSFAPWIAFTIISAIADWRLAAALALCISLAVAVARRQEDTEPNDLANATTVFFATLTIVSIANPSSGLQHYIPALAPAALGTGAGLSILRGRPFTIPFAKRSTPPELWDQPRFYAANVTISMIWTISFAVTAALLATVLAPLRTQPAWWSRSRSSPSWCRCAAPPSTAAVSAPATPPWPPRERETTLDDHHTRHRQAIPSRRQLPAGHR